MSPKSKPRYLTYNEGERLWNKAQKSSEDAEKAYMEALEYVGLYHVRRNNDLRDVYTHLANDISKMASTKFKLVL